MKNQLLTILVMAILISCTGPVKKTIEYPLTKKGDVIDSYFGTKVPDPYRWLEDDKSTETSAWVKEQNKVTFGYLEAIPYREDIKSRLEKMWNYEKYTAPQKEGAYTYFSRNNGYKTSLSFIVRKTMKILKYFSIRINFLLTELRLWVKWNLQKMAVKSHILSLKVVRLAKGYCTGC